MYRPGDTNIKNSGPNTVIKQQWLLLQQQNRLNIHPHDATINNLIITVKGKQKHSHDTVVTMDGNEPFVNAKGEIAKLCKACQLYDPFNYRHNLPNNISIYIRGTKQIYFILVSYNILKKLIQCGMIAINELTTTDHRSFHLNLSYTKVMKQKANEVPCPFDRQLQLKCPTSVIFYKKFLEKKTTTQNLEAKASTLLTIAQQQTLTQQEDESLNKLDNQITTIMLNAEKKINWKQTSPWSPELHIAIQTVTLWKLTLTQLKTKISQHKNITAIQNKLTLTINLEWKNLSDIFHHLKMA